MGKRVDYIDVIKGIAIFGVVWRHTTCPSWLTLNFIFFILGGFFFKRKPLKTFLFEKIRYILIPFFFFYLVSYVFDILLFLWRIKTLTNYHWDCIWDVLQISTRTDYLLLNIPLWFLLCFFTIQVLYYFISYLDKRLILILAICCLCFKDFFFSTPAPLMINVAFYNLGYFALGNVIGRPWIEKLKDVRFRKFSSAISFFLFAGLLVRIGGLSEDMYNVVYHTKLLMAFFIMMSIASWFNGNSSLSLVRFFGENSLLVLGMHWFPLTLIKLKTISIYGECTPLMGFIQTLIVMAIMYVVILFCNKYIPFFVGKKVPTKEESKTEIPVVEAQTV